MKTAKARLLTIVAPVPLGDAVCMDLRALGVSGYTTMHVNGFGGRGARTYGLTDGANLRIETVVSESLCDRIMDHLGTNYADESIIDHAHDVSAIPAEHFVSVPKSA